MNLLENAAFLATAGTVVGILIKEVFDVLKKRSDRKAEKTDEVKALNQEISLLQEEMEESRKERSVICFALLACLDGLIQNGANGAVTKAHERLEKHLNKKAHGLDE